MVEVVTQRALKHESLLSGFPKDRCGPAEEWRPAGARSARAGDGWTLA